ncbi:hypothetical protein MHBO_001589 [Bonamia ostreae]|uniref:SKP1-like protein n=1 Tax=Bonamia ostreae TaxID=126728 RepID=A0ABV2AK29_9EUKA
MDKTNKEKNPKSANDAEQKTLNLLSKEEESHPIDIDIAMKSSLIRTIWEGDRTERAIPLINVGSSELKKVIEFLKYHKNVPFEPIPTPLKSKNMREIVPEWDANFIEMDQSSLFKIILAANYLDIRDLLDLSCAKVATMIKGKSVEAIRECFGIENDFTKEELKAVKIENGWTNIE